MQIARKFSSFLILHFQQALGKFSQLCRADLD
jgi:hypothetical protein